MLSERCTKRDPKPRCDWHLNVSVSLRIASPITTWTHWRRPPGWKRLATAVTQARQRRTLKFSKAGARSGRRPYSKRKASSIDLRLEHIWWSWVSNYEETRAVGLAVLEGAFMLAISRTSGTNCGPRRRRIPGDLDTNATSLGSNCRPECFAISSSAL